MRRFMTGTKKPALRGLRVVQLFQLPANHRGVFTTKLVSLLASTTDGFGIGWCAGVAVGVAGGLLCQLLHYVKGIEHQLCHVDAAGTYPDHRRNYLLLHRRHAFTNLPNLLGQAPARGHGAVAGNVCRLITGNSGFSITADAGQPVSLHGLAVIPGADLLNGSGHQRGGTQNAGFIRGLNGRVTAHQLPRFRVCLDSPRH